MVPKIIPMRVMLVYTMGEIMQYYKVPDDAFVGTGKSMLILNLLLSMYHELKQPDWAKNPDEYWEW